MDDTLRNCFHWKVVQHKKEILKGDIGLIWCSGMLSGIYAVTKLISDPGEFVESAAEKKYWDDDSYERGSQSRVKMKLFIDLHDEPIIKEVLRQTIGLQDLSILRMSRGTNFPVTENEWTLIKILMGI